ncbi:MAG TPA: protein kinase [Myxococcales bacterium LLY-WYZ-16_1]|nr:protein kinase [Myxococcales bacterium LLY-WYZ-16_1]
MVAAQVGLFSLDRVIGRGGIAQVFSGRHRTQDVPVAVKVVTSDQARREAFRSTFEIEVQAMARLDHPAVARVLDYGEIPKSAQIESEGQLVAGSPYLVMELASQGSLERLSFPLPWQTTHGILVTVLDALAHAHARNVVHRDLKPANILLASPTDLRPGLKLTDFGIAQALGEENGHTTLEAMAAVGTPSYMAPEQLFGEWRDQGPWTDLYALGCVAYQLCTGRLPFRGKSLLSIAKAHLEVPLDHIPLPEDHPPELADWIRRLLEKEPARRFQRAADAAFALRKFAGDPPGVGRSLPLQRSVPDSEKPTVLDTLPLTTLDFSNPSSTTDSAEVLQDLAADVPPLPRSWQNGEAAPSIQLLGAGIGLFGLRTLPMVDRTEERDLLWHALARVRQRQQPHFHLLRGVAGVGKSRVAEWIAQRADEVGSAFVFKVRCGRAAGPADEIVRSVARFFRVDGLDGTELAQRMGKHLDHLGITDEHGRQTLTELLEPPRAEQTGGVGQDPEARHQAVLWLLSRLARIRPVLIWLDDLQWGLDVLRFTSKALERGAGRPILMIGTLREEALLERPAEAEELRRVLDHERTEESVVEGLHGADHRALIGRMLGLEPSLADRVAERTGGNPLFAIQLVGDWVERSALVLGPDGFVLARDEAGNLPEDLSALCSARVRTAIGDRRGDRQLLELAALLGEQVVHREWKEAAAEMGLAPSRNLISALVRSQLAVLTRDGWRFGHGVIQESLIEQAIASKDHVRYREAIVAMLTRVHGVNAFGVSERIGRHLLAAGRYEEAASRLLKGARDRHRQSDIDGLLAVLEDLRDALAVSGASASDRRWGMASGLEVQALTVRGKLEQAESKVEDLLRSTRQYGWQDIEAEATVLSAQVAYDRGDLARALDLYGQGLRAAETASNDGMQLRAQLGLAETVYRLGDHPRAQAHYRSALRVATRQDDPVGKAEVHWGLGYIALWQNELELARSHFESQRKLFAECGNRLGLGRCLNALGEVARFAGDLDEAERLYRSAVQVQSVIGVSGVIPSRLNLSLVLMEQRRFAESKRAIDRVLEDHALERTYRCCAMTQRMASHADAQNWSAWDADCREALGILEEIQLVDGDLAFSLQTSGDVALSFDQRERARAAYEAARMQWQALGRADKVAEIDDALLAAR